MLLVQKKTPMKLFWLVTSVIICAAACNSSKDKGESSAESGTGSETGTSEASPEAGKEGEAAKATEAATVKPEDIVTAKPQPIPADLLRVEKVEEIPQELFDDIQTRNDNDRPSIFTLKQDVVIQGVPCAKGKKISVLVNTDALAGCFVPFDVEVSGGHFLAGTYLDFADAEKDHITFEPSHSHWLMGVPVAAADVNGWSRKTGLSKARLAIDHTINGMTFTAGTDLDWTENTPERQRLLQARLNGEHTINGQTYPDKTMLYFKIDGTIEEVELPK